MKPTLSEDMTLAKHGKVRTPAGEIRYVGSARAYKTIDERRLTGFYDGLDRELSLDWTDSSSNTDNSGNNKPIEAEIDDTKPDEPGKPESKDNAGAGPDSGNADDAVNIPAKPGPGPEPEPEPEPEFKRAGVSIQPGTKHAKYVDDDGS